MNTRIHYVTSNTNQLPNSSGILVIFGPENEQLYQQVSQKFATILSVSPSNNLGSKYDIISFQQGIYLHRSRFGHNVAFLFVPINEGQLSSSHHQWLMDNVKRYQSEYKIVVLSLTPLTNKLGLNYWLSGPNDNQEVLAGSIEV